MGNVVNHNSVVSPFTEILNEFTEIVNLIFSPLVEFSENKKIKQNADILIEILLEESIKKNASQVIVDEILKSMPEGIWNVETIGLVESKFKLIYDQDFMSRLKNDNRFQFKDANKRNYFLKSLLSKSLAMQLTGLDLFKKQLSLVTIKEKNLTNLKLGREIVQTIDLMNEKSKDLLKKIKKTSDLSTNKFAKYMKKFWTCYTLLFLRILDIIILSNNKEI